MLPNFICPGAQKSATTTLYELLKQHPDIYLPNEKEPNFFAEKKYYKKGLKWYERYHYSKVKNEKVIGDISTGYMPNKEAVKRIKEALGEDMKFIFMLRNPIERAYSHYNMEFNAYRETLSFIEALYAEKDRLKKTKNKRFDYTWDYTYIHNGMYANQISNFLQYYPKNKMYFVIFEEFITNIEEEMSKIVEFLHLENYKFDFNINQNKAFVIKNKLLSKIIVTDNELKRTAKKIIPQKFRKQIKNTLQKNIEKKEMPQDAKEILVKVYKKDIDKLQYLINKDLSIWRLNHKNQVQLN